LPYLLIFASNSKIELWEKVTKKQKKENAEGVPTEMPAKEKKPMPEKEPKRQLQQKREKKPPKNRPNKRTPTHSQEWVFL
jgi:hypothetical protein